MQKATDIRMPGRMPACKKVGDRYVVIHAEDDEQQAG